MNVGKGRQSGHGSSPKAADKRSGGGNPASSNGSKLKGGAREAALDVLLRIEQDRSYSNLLLHQILLKYNLGKPDVGLTTEIVYGTIQRLNTIDYFLGRFVAKGMAKLEPWVRSLLRLSFYQIYYLDRIPDHAVVNEAVNMAKRKGHQGISGMVNGVLRNIIRQKESLQLPAGLPPAERIALTHSHPEWLVRRWISQLGEVRTEQICEANNVPPRVSIRVNTLKQSRSKLIELLQQAGLEAEASELAPDGVIVRGGGNMALTSWYADGLFSIQDESSMLVALSLDPQPGEKILDCCAAPGGKTTHIAEKMGDRGELWACDIHEHKEKLVQEQAERLGLSSVHTVVTDARKLREQFAEQSFDRILLDAPCSGLGVIRRKPDMKWNKSEQEIEGICVIQHELLEHIHTLLRPGGVLVYSTCTLEYNENEGMVKQFLKAHPEFEWDQPQPLQIYPYEYHSDGFFIAKLRKRA
ncbi:16S rRNA (cytosine(967)-C(5))-methyltransferase RsmB [Paenibacillus radicis (ex Xue et al. 2023)]|uniref:16S rRNA (cytosine(967)-C(5))-methyltransferase n=1 Tax=Paenibacillus radicis (ex Xue et al. 2023) TaxID=2972489 RepID=A0ABT1YKV7_9BACL|nr:16S rRNA (cytosine(967)-C(5))-methyltransferase RsmB [Paenibacillus radicis (ex Xue et al. 2023)]MCR8633627.1 16S rRNA (cytosine(967)-C(5))-methyltransferase RsmB [Paenibacillus radicis (ex Xue et al. 2023)]